MKTDNYIVKGEFEIQGKPNKLDKYLNEKKIQFCVISKDIHCVKIDSADLKKCEVIDTNIEQGRRFKIYAEVEVKVKFVEDATISKYLTLKAYGKRCV